MMQRTRRAGHRVAAILHAIAACGRKSASYLIFCWGAALCTIDTLGLLRRKLQPTNFAARHERNEGRQRMNVLTRQAYAFEDLEIGMEASFAKTVSAAD